MLIDARSISPAPSGKTCDHVYGAPAPADERRITWSYVKSFAPGGAGLGVRIDSGSTTTCSSRFAVSWSSTGTPESVTVTWNAKGGLPGAGFTEVGRQQSSPVFSFSVMPVGSDPPVSAKW